MSAYKFKVGEIARHTKSRALVKIEQRTKYDSMFSEKPVNIYLCVPVHAIGLFAAMMGTNTQGWVDEDKLRKAGHR